MVAHGRPEAEESGMRDWTQNAGRVLGNDRTSSRQGDCMDADSRTAKGEKEAMTNAEYRAHPAISRSDLFKLTKSPQHFRYEMDHPSPKTPSLIFGAALHKWVLEPDDFESEFVIAPNVNRRTKEGRAYWEMFLADNDGKEIISASRRL